ncbi:MAG: hypothetical protein J4F41_00155 [Alphaproteobacteria bacterium]|nr:hypothetical protein [Alphaproteobacteria bacterium]
MKLTPELLKRFRLYSPPARLSTAAMAALVGLKFGRNWGYFESPESAATHRRLNPCMRRAVILIWWYVKTTGALPDFDKLEDEMVNELDQPPK